MTKKEKKKVISQTEATGQFAESGGPHTKSASEDLGRADTDRDNQGNNPKQSSSFTDRIQQMCEWIGDAGQLKSALENLYFPNGFTEERRQAAVGVFITRGLRLQIEKSCSQALSRFSEDTQEIPFQDVWTANESSFFFRSDSESNLEFRDTLRVRLYLLGKEIEPMILEISRINHALSDCSFPPKMSYRQMRSLENRRSELINKIVCLLTEEGIMKSRTRGLKLSTPFQNVVGHQIEDLANANPPCSQSRPMGEAGAHIAKPKRKNRGRRRKAFQDAFPNQETFLREKQRFMDFLRKKKAMTRRLTCVLKSFLNQVITCFLVLWSERGILAKEALSGGSVFRFLTNECGLKSEVQENSFSNKLATWLKLKKYDPSIMTDVRSAFA
jgi:hypothetical protein